VNKWHEMLKSPEWAAFLHDEILPAVTQGVDLGDDLLEIMFTMLHHVPANGLSSQGCGRSGSTRSR
jgi:hypothetical protein